jgi:hypothetical protein
MSTHPSVRIHCKTRLLVNQAGESNQKRVAVLNETALHRVYREGVKRRATEATLANPMSSRSHGIFDVFIHRTGISSASPGGGGGDDSDDDGGGGVGLESRVRLRLVDLAGSE